MTAKPRRATYRHGNLRAEALKAATRLVAEHGHERLSLREVAEAVGVAHRSLYNHFVHREALLDAVATEAYLRLAGSVAKAKTPEDYTARYVRFALANRALYALMTSRPHATMKHNPPLQTAVHKVITEAMRIFARDIASSAERRRATGDSISAQKIRIASVMTMCTAFCSGGLCFMVACGRLVISA